MEIPKVPGLPIIGHSIPFQRNALNFTAEKQKKYGDIFQISLLNENFIVLLTPEITKEVFLDKDDNFSSKEGWAVTLGQHLKTDLCFETLMIINITEPFFKTLSGTMQFIITFQSFNQLLIPG